MLSFDQSVFLNKAKIMVKVYDNLAPTYLQELFHMRDVNFNQSRTNGPTNAHLTIAQVQVQRRFFCHLKRNENVSRTKRKRSENETKTP